MFSPASQADPAVPEGAPLRLGVCGLGYGLHHITQLQLSPQAHRVSIVAVCDVRPERLAAGAAALHCPGYADLAAMLAGADLEAVALFSGPVGRASLIRQVIRAGRDVMTTKPLELDADSARLVLEEAARLGRTVFLNSPAPVLGADVRQILAWQAQYGLGRLLLVRMDCWYRSTEKPDGSWYDDPDLCPVAPIFRLGIYGINDTLAVAAGELAELQVLQARVRTGRPTPDIAQLSLRFTDGLMAVIRATWCCGPIRDNQVSEFVFEHGVIDRNYSDRDHRRAPETVLHLEAETAAGTIVQDDATVSNLAVNSAYRWDLFHQAIRGRRPDNLVPPASLVRGVQVIAAMRAAQQQGGSWRAPSATPSST